MPLALREKRQKRNSFDDPEEFRATLGEHLEDLRDRILKSVGLLALGITAGWFLEPWLYSFLNGMAEGAIKPALPPGAEYKEVFRNLTEMFMLKLRLSAMIGLVLAFPFIVLQIWGFIAPGLKPSERKPLRLMAPFSVGLFALGATFAWIVLPAAFRWFVSFLGAFGSASLYQEPGSMIFFALKMIFAFGFAFQLPLFVFLMGKLGLLSADVMLKYWRQATVAIFFVSALITPGADPFSMLLMALPLVLLFVLSVYAVKYTSRLEKRDPILDDLD
jgi:sec-independent protein translocase protein TatC